MTQDRSIADRDSLGRGEITALTSLRGVAAVGVLLLHFRDQFGPALNPDHITQFFARGYLFVDFFFVLSGFVISLSYAQTFAKHISLREYFAFLVKRLARIYPLHILVLAGFVASEAAKYAVTTTANPPFSVNTGTALVANIFLVQAWGGYDHYTWNNPAWSISTEWFAYIIFPLLTICIMRIRNFGQIAAVTLASAAVLEFFFVIRGRPHEVSIFLLRCVPSFIFGMLIYRFRVLASESAKLHLASDFSFMTAIVFAFLTIAMPCPDIISVGAFVFIVLCGSLNRGRISRGLSAKPLHFLGVISYSIYLTHALLLRVWQMLFQVVWHSRMTTVEASLAFVILMATVVIASAISYQWIEEPGRKYFGRFAKYVAKRERTRVSPNDAPGTRSA